MLKPVLCLFFAALPLYGAGIKPEDLDVFKAGVEIARMLGEDQAGRFGYMVLMKKGYSNEELGAHPEVGGFGSKTDKEHAEKMKQIVERWGWVTISKFGEYASHNAWLLVQHADHDVDFQERCLALMQPYIEKKDIELYDYAYLFDRVHVNREKPQSYGTQGECKGPGNWVPKSIENPEKVDERRAQFGMGPLKDYIQVASQMCKS